MVNLKSNFLSWQKKHDWWGCTKKSSPPPPFLKSAQEVFRWWKSKRISSVWVHKGMNAVVFALSLSASQLDWLMWSLTSENVRRARALECKKPRMRMRVSSSLKHTSFCYQSIPINTNSGCWLVKLRANVDSLLQKGQWEMKIIERKCWSFFLFRKGWGFLAADGKNSNGVDIKLSVWYVNPMERK